MRKPAKSYKHKNAACGVATDLVVVVDVAVCVVSVVCTYVNGFGFACLTTPLHRLL